MDIKYSLLFLLFLCLLSCSTEENGTEGLIVFENGEILIELISVEDSRCPLDVVCAWEGDAIVSMTISSQDSVSEFTLNSNPNVKNGQIEIELFDYVLKLIDVSPYPVSSSRIELEDYVISLDVQRL